MTRLDLLRRECARCHETKPWSEFAVRTRWEDGSVRTVESNCRPCKVELAADWVRRHREYRAAYFREYRRLRRARELAPLPVEPLRVFLERVIAAGVTHDSIQERTGVSARAVRRVLHESERVSLGLADTLVTRLGGTFSLVYNDERMVA